jgi:ribonuclease HI
MAVYVDGACSVNPGPGGWGVLIIRDGKHYEYGGHKESTTNNIMEMTAALEALKRLKDEEGPITIYTDSQYLKNGITKWIHLWKVKGWKKADGEEVLNLELWQELSRLIRPEIRWEWVKGHADNVHNNRVDKIARAFSRCEPISLLSGDTEGAAAPPPSAGDEVKEARPARASRGNKTYLSLVGGTLERHDTWELCQQRVTGVPGAKYKMCKNSAEEEEILTAWGLMGAEPEKPAAGEVPAPTAAEGAVLVCLPFINQFCQRLAVSGFEEIESRERKRIFQKNTLQIEMEVNGLFTLKGTPAGDLQKLASSLALADDDYLARLLKSPPVKFRKDLSCWGRDQLSIFLRPFMKEMVSRWDFSIEDNLAVIRPRGSPENEFSITTGDEWDWETPPPEELDGLIRESAERASVFPDRLAWGVAGDVPSGQTVVLLPLCGETQQMAGARPWSEMRCPFDSLQDGEKTRIKGQLRAGLKKYWWMRIPPGTRKTDDEKISRWLKAAMEEASRMAGKFKNPIPIDLITPPGDEADLLQDALKKIQVPGVIRPPEYPLERESTGLAGFLAGLIHGGTAK